MEHEVGSRDAAAAVGVAEALGPETGAFLLTIFQDFYRQEVSAEEDVHRTLPFFATALGLVLAALNYVAVQLPTWTDLRRACAPANDRLLSWVVARCTFPAGVAGAFLVGAAVLSGSVLLLLARATVRRPYQRVGPAAAHIERAGQLRDFHQRLGLQKKELDAAVTLDLRQQILEDLAVVVEANRQTNEQRYKWRARAVWCLLWSLLCTLLATISLLVTAKTGFAIKAAP